MSARLLDPKVHFVERKLLTEKQLNSILRKLKQKKYGFKDYAVDVEEVTIDKDAKQRSASGQSVLNTIKHGTYFNIRVEYIV